MKILIVTNHSYMLWQFRRELVEALKKKHDIVLSMPFVGHEDDFCAMNCRCIDTPMDRRGINPVTDVKLYRFYINLLQKENPDMVVTFSIKPNIYAGLACGRRRIPFYANVQGLGTAFQKKGLAQMVTWMYRTALKHARTVFFENQENAVEFLRRRIIPEKKSLVLKGAGVNLDYYAQCPYSEEYPLHFLFVGRIMKEKGVGELFSAARKLKTRYGDRVVFDLVGFFEDGYKEEVERLQKQHIIVFHGFQSEVRPYYKTAHCVVLPSYHEGMSNVLLEAASSGRALITSDIPGCREAVDDGVTGYLCRAQNAGDLQDKMEAFLRLSSQQRAAMGQAGRWKMEQEFDKKAVVAQTAAAILQENQEESSCLIS